MAHCRLSAQIHREPQAILGRQPNAIPGTANIGPSGVDVLVIHPDSVWKIIFDAVVGIAVVYSSVTVPLSVSFGLTRTAATSIVYVSVSSRVITPLVPLAAKPEHRMFHNAVVAESA